METCKRYPSDVSDEEWAFVVPYLTLLPLDAEQHPCSLKFITRFRPGLLRLLGAILFAAAAEKGFDIEDGLFRAGELASPRNIVDAGEVG